MPRRREDVGVHAKQPDGTWKVEVMASSLKVGQVIRVEMRNGSAWMAPVKRIVGRRGKVFIVDLDKKLRDCPRAPKRQKSSAPSGVFFR